MKWVNAPSSYVGLGLVGCRLSAVRFPDAKNGQERSRDKYDIRYYGMVRCYVAE